MQPVQAIHFRRLPVSVAKQLTVTADSGNHAGFIVCDAVSLYRLLAISLLAAAACLMAACSSMTVQEGPDLDTSARWVLLPVANNSESPQAAEKLEAILPTLLRVRGVDSLTVYSPEASTDVIPVLDDKVRFDKGLDWALRNDYKYGITGSVEEWQYKSGVEREPAVGLSLRVVSIPSGRVLWSASAARSGWGRETVSGTAQELADAMLDTAQFKNLARR